MNSYHYDMNAALASEKLNRLLAEAANHRQAKSFQPQRPGVLDRLVQAIGQGLISIAETFKVDRRPRLPAI